MTSPHQDKTDKSACLRVGQMMGWKMEPNLLITAFTLCFVFVCRTGLQSVPGLFPKCVGRTWNG